MAPVFLCRYDTEGGSPEEMAGFFEKAVEVHRADAIPATFFCRGGAIDERPSQFDAFWQEVEDDPLFDLQDHSYTHIGIGYEAGPSVVELRADYEKSFAAHDRAFGKRPVGISICGTSGRDGAHLPGFDATDKAGQEFEMLVGLGVRMLDCFLTGIDGSREFCDYGRLGRPDVMGFPSAFSDTEWMHRRACGDPVSYVTSLIDERGERGQHMPLMLHDWCAWNFAPDKELTHVRIFAHHARKRGYELTTHATCLDRPELWKE